MISILDILLCFACPGRALVAFEDGSMLLMPLSSASDEQRIEVVLDAIDE